MANKKQVTQEMTDELAVAITAVSDSAQKLLDGRLNSTAIQVLIKHDTGISMAQISRVLTSAAALKRNYLK